MKPEDHILLAGRLLDLVQEMEQIIKDYCRLIAAKDDGPLLEKSKNDYPF